MKKIFLINFILSITFLFSECSDLDYDLCIYYSQYCEWSETASLCTEIGGGGTGGGGSGSGCGVSEGDAPTGDGLPQTERLQILSTVVPR